MNEIQNDDKLLNYILELKFKWNPQKQMKTGDRYHGSNKGDEMEYVLYFDEYNCEWASEERAFQGYVFKNISKIIQQLYV